VAETLGTSLDVHGASVRNRPKPSDRMERRFAASHSGDGARHGHRSVARLVRMCDESRAKDARRRESRPKATNSNPSLWKICDTYVTVPGTVRPAGNNPHVDGATPKMVFLGYGKYARADRIYALQPITDERRGGGSRTLVWVDGIPEAIVASRTERTILLDMGQEAAGSPLIDEALAFAERVADDADKGRVDLADLGRRARRLLEQSVRSGGDSQQLF
jgi:hypothetical protein